MAKSDEWFSPPWIFEEMGLRFDLDPSSPGLDRTPWIPADRCYTKKDDGLYRSWSVTEPGGKVRKARWWLNCPYSANDLWLHKALLDVEDGGRGVILNFCKMETLYIQALMERMDGMFCIRRRVEHIPGDGQDDSQNLHGSVLFAFGQEEADALYRMDGRGLGVFSERRRK